MKYTFEEKLAAVKHYIKTGGFDYPDSCDTASRKHAYAGYVRFWKAQYELKGEDGLRHKECNDVYSPEKKLSIIAPVLSFQVSCTMQSKKVGISHGQLQSWIKRYKEKGMDGLKCSKRGRPAKNMEPVKEEKKTEAGEAMEEDLESLRKRNADLEHKNLLLQFELDYAKKMNALAERKERSERMRRQRSSARSSKAKNTEGN